MKKNDNLQTKSIVGLSCAIALVVVASCAFTYHIAYGGGYEHGYADGGMKGVSMTKTEFYDDAVATKNRCAHKIGSYTVRHEICDDHNCTTLSIYCQEDFWP